MPQAFTKQQLLTKSASLKGLVGKYKVAQEGGNLGPEEVKEIAEETISVLTEAMEMVDAVAEGVPADDVPSSPVEEVESPVVVEEEEEAPIATEGEEDDDEEKRKLMGKVASLEKDLANIKMASAKEKLASEYAALWPPKQAKAKHASFMKSKGSLEILQAKLDEAKSIMSNTKIASMPNNHRPLYDSFTETSKERVASDNREFDASQITMVI